MNGLCCRRVRRFKRVGFRQCHNPGMVERDGKLYCVKHDPEARERYRQTQNERRQREVEHGAD